MMPLLEFLTSRQGRLSGTGTNGEGMNFTAHLDLRARVSDNLIELAFQARDSESAFHEEVTWITSDLLQDRLALWTVSSNTPGVLQHELIEDREDERSLRRLVFSLGQRDEKRSFRQEITLDFLRDGSIEYLYGWGVPHEEFASRIHTKLRPEHGDPNRPVRNS
jgi:hypothetical protein